MDQESVLDVKAPIIGIIKYKSLSSIFGHFNIIDIESYRNAMGYFFCKQIRKQKSAKIKQTLLDTDNLDSSFESGDIFFKLKHKIFPIQLICKTNEQKKYKKKLIWKTELINLILIKTKTWI